MTDLEYKEFLAAKKALAEKSGFEVSESGLNPKLKDFQKFIVKKALEHGRYGVFAAPGLGKTFMQLEWAKKVHEFTGRPVLILAPLAVVNQTKETEAGKFGYKVFSAGSLGVGGIEITNYDQLENIDTSIYSGIVLDESSILKSLEGKKKNLIIERFKETPYKLACSATPSPNDHMELGNHSEFLGQMSYTEMLAMFFVHDGGETSKWRLRKHAEKDFWNYVLSWAVAIDNPATFGFDGAGYTLPKVHYIEHFIDVESDSLNLFGEAIVSATDLHQELRKSEKQRLDKAVEIFNEGKNDQWLFWCIQNEEAKKLEKLIPDSVNVKGGDSPEFKAKNLAGFCFADPKNLISKTSIAAFGMNYQHANHMMFVSYDFSWEKFFQAIRRMLRFGQQREVFVHLLIPKNQMNVRAKIEEADRQHNDFIKNLSIMSSQHEKDMTEKPTYNDVITDHYKCLIGDCIERSKDIADNEADLVVFSPPFPTLYIYSDKIADMGNSKDYNEFEKHFKYLIPQIKRTLKPGRICAVHCMDVPVQKGKEGYIGLRDFSGMLIDWFQQQGFIYHSRVTIWKNPVTEMQRTKALGLLHKQIKKDSVMSRVGIPDYVLFFRNEGDNEIPITHQDTDPAKKDYLPVDLWQKYASPVWYDIDYGNTLNYTSARDGNDERHIAPLQLDTIERILHLYSNEGETVCSFFGGIGSEGYKAIEMNRKSISIELKESYFKINTQNHRNAVEKKSMLTLFPM